MPKHLNTADDFEMVAIERLIPAPYNPNAGDFGAIHESIEANGFFGALVVSRRTRHVLAGNHRLAVALKMGYESLPVTWVDVDLDGEKRILLADNRTARLGNDDPNALAKLLAELAGTDKGLSGTGFDGDDLDALISELAGMPQSGLLDDADPDAIPDDAPTRVKPGDLWQLGNHRLLCGDSTKPEDVARLMGGEEIRMVWTDPPYGVGYQDNESVEDLKARNRRTDGKVVAYDSMTEKQTEELSRSALSHAADCALPGAVCYVASPQGTLLPHFISAVAKSGFDYKWQLVWVKNMFVLGRSDYHFRHENILYGWKPGGAHYFVDDRTKDSVFEIDRPRASPEHPTMKPVDLVKAMVENSSKAGDLVYDPFGGSGTTLLACEATGRKGRTIEFLPAYADVILSRWEKATGRVAELIENGTT